MYSQIIHPSEALRPYITRYVFVRAEGSTDTMMPPSDDPRFINGKHVQPLLPNYGSMVFMRDVTVDFNGIVSDGLTLLGANQKTIIPAISRHFLIICTKVSISLFPAFISF